MIILFIFANLTVIMFRESKISSYRPQFFSPLYPFMQIFGVLSGGFLLIEMGTFTVFLTMGFILLGFVWYRVYAKRRAKQDSALIHLLEKLVSKDRELTSENLLTELKDIVIQRDDLSKDKFHKLIEAAKILDIEEALDTKTFFNYIADILAKDLGLKPGYLFEKFIKREKESSTVIKKGLAIPHIIIKGEGVFEILLTRAKAGAIFPNDEVVHAMFIIVSSRDERVQHLRVLAAIAQVCQNPEFDKKWDEAKGEDGLRNIVLLAERKRE